MILDCVVPGWVWLWVGFVLVTGFLTGTFYGLWVGRG